MGYDAGRAAQLLVTFRPVVPSRARRRALVRALFLVVVLALVAQALYAYAVEEPYPSFVFPSFSGAPDDEGAVRVLRPHLLVHFTDPSRVIEVPYQQLLSPAPGVAADAIAYTVFAPPVSDTHPGSVPGQFRLFLEQPSFERGAWTPSTELRDQRTRAWLRSRLLQLFPGQHVRTLEIRWDRYRYVNDSTSFTEPVTTQARLRVPIDG